MGPTRQERRTREKIALAFVLRGSKIATLSGLAEVFDWLGLADAMTERASAKPQ